MPAATVTLDALEEKGWYLSEEGIDYVKEQSGNDVLTLDQFVDAAKDIDLRELVDKGFRKGDLTKLSQLPANLVLQVLQVQNIAVPTIQHVEKPRLLRVVFTDGSKKKWIGAEILGQVESISLHTPPGTKFLVTKPIEIREQLLILGPGMLTCLGGQVQEMIQAWKAGKQFIKRSKGKQSSLSEDMPPPFIPFKIKPNRSTRDDERTTKQTAPPKDDPQDGKGRGGEKKYKSTKPNGKKENNSGSKAIKTSSGRTPSESVDPTTTKNNRKKGSTKGNNKDPSDKDKKKPPQQPKDATEDKKKPSKPKDKGATDKKKPQPKDKDATDDMKKPQLKDKEAKDKKKPTDRKDNRKKTDPSSLDNTLRQPFTAKNDPAPITSTVLSATSKPFVPSGMILSPPPPPPSSSSHESVNTPLSSSRGRGGNRGRGNRGRGRGRGANQAQ